MRFLPHTPDDVERMLKTIGVDATTDLFSTIPASLRLRAKLDLPQGLGEREVFAEIASLADANGLPASFQGAGSYRHYVPAVVQQILGRSEFATAYTPYQPEVSQGTLQATFEFQTYVALLTGMDVANASVYDGASALAEAVLMSLRINSKRDRVLLSSALHPEYRHVVRTYLRGFGRGTVEEVAIGADGRTDLALLESMMNERVATVAVGYPNVYGVIEDLRAAAKIAHEHGALAISSTSEALSLALLASPGACDVDIAVAEGQSLGLPMSYGGPGVGLFATRTEHLRSRGRNRRRPRPARLRSDAVHARATHSARESDVEHLHEPGACGACRDRLPGAGRPPRLARARGRERAPCA
jgi:glycine dehydrogenase subunit 1